MAQAPTPSSSVDSPPPPYVLFDQAPPVHNYQPSSSISEGLLVGIIVPVVVVILIIVGAVLYCRKKKLQDEQIAPTNNTDNLNPQRFDPVRSPIDKQNNKRDLQHGLHYQQARPNPSVIVQMTQNMYTFDELRKATNKFSPDNLLGQGGFGQVFKGMVNGMEVAVKKLKLEGCQGDKEFRAEVEIISRVHHKNLVSLVGHCIHQDQRLLVYEFVPNKTLEFHLGGNNQVILNWQNRLKIAQGAARGLAYLHEDCHPKIIHRDIKTPNILLDLEFEPKVADFGLAKFQPKDQTHVSTRIMGTFGYIAPEFANSGQLTDKADVYAFGVILLELITGRPPVMLYQSNKNKSLVDWARPLLAQALEDGKYDELIDPHLGLDYDRLGMTRMMKCAFVAIQQTPSDRPSMIQIAQNLQGEVVGEDLHSRLTSAKALQYPSAALPDTNPDYQAYQTMEEIGMDSENSS